jgi:aspartokinase
MSAEELYALARQKEQEQQEQEREQLRRQIEQLREKRKELIAEHKKALAAIDKEIKALGGRRSAGGAARQHGDISQRILAVLASRGKCKTSELKAELEQQGVEVKNLNQQLAYLKRKGRVSNPGRGIYAIVRK